jgi:hypothetical protein
MTLGRAHYPPRLLAAGKRVRGKLIQRLDTILRAGKLPAPYETFAHPGSDPDVNAEGGLVPRAYEHVDDLTLVGGKLEEFCEQH